jgi:hypothetical protein
MEGMACMDGMVGVVVPWNPSIRTRIGRVTQKIRTNKAAWVTAVISLPHPLGNRTRTPGVRAKNKRPIYTNIHILLLLNIRLNTVRLGNGLRLIKREGHILNWRSAGIGITSLIVICHLSEVAGALEACLEIDIAAGLGAGIHGLLERTQPAVQEIIGFRGVSKIWITGFQSALGLIGLLDFRRRLKGLHHTLSSPKDGVWPVEISGLNEKCEEHGQK